MKIEWEKRYSLTLDDDKMGRWMRIGRINGMTVAIMTKVKFEREGINEIRFLTKLPNNTGNESIQNNIVSLTEGEALAESERYIIKYFKEAIKE